jgi:hypothetical protein
MAEQTSRRPRALVVLGSLAMIASGFLPWWQAGGDSVNGVELPEASGIGLEGPGIVIYVVAIASLVLLDIGYIRGRWGFILDTGVVYLALGLVAAGALGYRAWELWSVGYLPLPDRSPGLAAAAIGIAFLLYGAGLALTTPRRSPYA